MKNDNYEKKTFSLFPVFFSLICWVVVDRDRGIEDDCFCVRILKSLAFSILLFVLHFDQTNLQTEKKNNLENSSIFEGFWWYFFIATSDQRGWLRFDCV